MIYTTHFKETHYYICRMYSLAAVMHFHQGIIFCGVSISQLVHFTDDGCLRCLQDVVVTNFLIRVS